MTLPALCTREDVAGALDVAASARAYSDIDRLIGEASRSIETLCHRARFYPEVTTLVFDWPTRRNASSFRLWLDSNDVLAVSTLTTGAQTVGPSSYVLSPQAYGPPYSSIELLVGTSPTGWSAGESWQRSISVTGTWCSIPDQTRPAGQLAAGVNASATTLDVSDAAVVGVGDLVTVGTERMVVTARSQLTTGQVLQADLAALNSSTSVAVTSGAGFHIGEQLLIDAERLQVEDIAGNTLVVTRAVAGSVLGSHSGATIYAPRRLTVERAALGTTAATHALADPCRVFDVPDPLVQLAIAETVVGLQRQQSGWARTIGAGEGIRAAPGGDLRDLRDRAVARYGRIARHRAV